MLGPAAAVSAVSAQRCACASVLQVGYRGPVKGVTGVLSFELDEGVTYAYVEASFTQPFSLSLSFSFGVEEFLLLFMLA